MTMPSPQPPSERPDPTQMSEREAIAFLYEWVMDQHRLLLSEHADHDQTQALVMAQGRRIAMLESMMDRHLAQHMPTPAKPRTAGPESPGDALATKGGA